MPGKRLNDKERKSIKWWQSTDPTGFLEEIEINGNGGSGLRGINSIKVRFDAPVTVISGKNGAGKSTILSLSALAFHGTSAFPAKNSRNGKYYTFQDFFFKGHSDPNITGVEISWKYKNISQPLTIKKRSDKWMRYERRPKRPVYFIGISRCVPAIEQSVLRGHFGKQSKSHKQKPLTPDAISHISEILGRKYESAETRESSKYKLRSCRNGASYTSFNMGTGEDIVIDLLSTLYTAETNSLIIIEEIELGLHPSAQKKLAQSLPKIALDKKIQIIISSHSEYIIDNLPRESRLFIEKGEPEHFVNYRPSTRTALSSLTNDSQAELLIFCEDEFAKSLIQSALPQHLRRRVHIVPTGADSELIASVTHHNRAGHKHKTLVIWDGDVSFTKIKKWATEELKKNPSLHLVFTKLPGHTPPEAWMIDKLLSSSEAVDEFTSRFQLNGPDETKDILLEALVNIDHHSLSDTISRRTNTAAEYTKVTTTQITTQMFGSEFTHLTELVSSILE